jgi:transitional endoplasmic reticulum ATPase
LLFGPPGTGKTYIMKAAAGEFKVPIIFLSGAELLKKGYYEAAIVLKEAFNRAKDNAPSIIFIDEIETVAPARTGASNPLMGQLLQEMDGIKDLKNVIVVGATNLPQTLDPALLRPGRFDRIIYIPPPSKEVRKEVFKIHLGKFAPSFDLDYLASITDGYSSADIKSLCEEIKLRLLQLSMQKAGKIKTLSNEEIMNLIKNRKPSITKDLLLIYERFIKEYGERK